LTVPATQSWYQRNDALLAKWWQRRRQRIHGTADAERFGTPVVKQSWTIRYDGLLAKWWQRRWQRIRSGT
jgi:hypothetical protein